tara:strand:+ start:212 stop:1231 length:1020 start_codon:yes stop_codon:yes gene_type:complete
MSNARKLADNLPSVGQLSGRNMIVNGAMNVAQRSASVTGLGANATGYYTVDRWQIETGGSNSGRFTMSQSSDAPSGFGNSLKLDCTTADTSIAAGEYLLLEYHIEGQDLQRIKKGTSDAEEVTISFYVKANAAHNFVLEFYDNDNNRTCSKLFSTTTSWNRVELTYPADTTGAFDNNTSSSVRLFFWIHAGSSYTSGTLNSSAFNTQNSANRAAGISSFYSSTNNELYITGVQMEVGPQATPFEHEPEGVTLSKCERYFYKLPIDSFGPFFCNYVPTHRFAHVWFPVRMRTTPTSTTTNAGGTIYEYHPDPYHTKYYVTAAYDTAASVYLQSFQADAEL